MKNKSNFYRKFVWIHLLLLSFLLGCVESKTKYFPDTGPILRSIQIQPSSLTLLPSEQFQLNPVLLASDSSQITDLPIQWVSGNSSIASVSSDGRVSAIARGRTYILASYQGLLSNTVLVNVTFPPTSFNLTPDSSFILTAGSVQLEWVAQDSLGQILEVEPELYSADTLIVLVDPSGRVTGRGEGITRIHGRLFQLRDSVMISVSSRFDSLRISPPQLTIQLGQSAPLTCLGWINNRVVYPTVIDWRSTQPSIVSIQPSGVVYGNALGSALISAASGNSVSLPLFINVEPTPSNLEFIAVATGDTLWEIGTVLRNRIFQFAFQSPILDVRKHPTEKIVAILLANNQFFISDFSDQYLSPSRGALYSEENPIAFSATGDFIIVLGVNGIPKSVNVNTMAEFPLSVPSGFTTFRWSKLPQVTETNWLIVGGDGSTDYYLTNSFTGSFIDTVRCAENSLSPVYSTTTNDAMHANSTFVGRISLVNTELSYQVTDTLSFGLRRWINVSRNHLSALALGENNRFIQFALPIDVSHYTEHPALADYTFLTFNTNPFEAYGAFDQQVFVLTSRYPVAFSWFTLPNPISALDR